MTNRTKTGFPMRVMIAISPQETEYRTLYSMADIEENVTMTILQKNVRVGKQMIRYLARVQNSTHAGLRYGQSVFNITTEYEPELAGGLEATDKDPFYDDSKVEIFLQAVFGDDGE